METITGTSLIIPYGVHQRCTVGKELAITIGFEEPLERREEATEETMREREPREMVRS